MLLGTLHAIDLTYKIFAGLVWECSPEFAVCAKLLRNFISFYHSRLPCSGMAVSPQHPGSSSFLVNAS
jgi:hypothetical protein